MRKRSRAPLLAAILGGLAFVAAIPARASESAVGQVCSRDVGVAYRELKEARAKGLTGSIALVEASTLLTGAKIQQEFGKYPNCIDKAQRARLHIKQAALDDGR